VWDGGPGDIVLGNVISIEHSFYNSLKLTVTGVFGPDH
jgi:hypothetical protein